MRRNTSHRRTPNRVAIAAVMGSACSLVSGSVLALELGDIQVESSLGQPLRASVGFTLNPNEQMFDFCVRLNHGLMGGAIPAVTRANISIVGNRIILTGDAAIKDPLLNLQVIVDCPYTPQLTRNYTLVVDPVEFARNPVVVAAEPATAPAPARATPVTAASAGQPVQIPETVSEVAPVSADDRPAVVQNSQYRVQSGDSVSGIASRIAGRGNSLQSAIALIVASNPQAFIDGDAARLMAGSLLTIPAMTEEPEGVDDGFSPTVPAIREYAPVAARVEPDPVAAVAPTEPVTNPVDAPTPAVAAAEANVSVASPAKISEPAAEAVEPTANSVAAPGIGETQAVASNSVADVPAEAVEPMIETTPETTATVVEPAEENRLTRTAEFTTGLTLENQESELQPGDVVVSPVAENATSDPADTPAPIEAAPVVSAPASSTQSGSNSWAWLTWPVGGAALLIGVALLLGRQIREKFASIAIGASDKPAPAPDTLVDVEVEPAPEPAEETVLEAADDPANEFEDDVTGVAEEKQTPAADSQQNVEAPQPVIDDVDFAFDDTVSSDAISLDADLDAGTGLQDGADMDVAQDFGFAASGQVENGLDHEIPAEAAREPEKSETDIIPPAHRETEPPILESEIAPEDDYDLSMIVDATKQTIDDTQLTVQDLQAVAVDQDTSDSYEINDDTLASEADLEALEADYQEEFTQTQALNQEIEEAARELAAKLDSDIDDDDPTGDEPILTIEDPGLDPTAEMPARAPEDELTAEMPARTIDSEVTAEMPAQFSATEVTAELAANVDAQNDGLAADVSDEEVTRRLAAAGSEPTVEMQIETVIAELEDDDE